MRFLRHLAAVGLVVAAVTGLGLAWNHFAASTLIGGLTVPREELAGPGGAAGGPPHGHVVLPKGARPGGSHGPVAIRSGPFDLGLNSMLQPVNWPYLRHTVVIETGVMVAVVIIDVSRRRSRRASRAAQLAQLPSGDGDVPDARPG
jgi:hypothetical protein